MKPQITRFLGAALLVLLPVHLCAQDLPRPKEFYFEADADVARPLELLPGDDEATVERLLKARERGRRGEASLAAAQLARIAYAGGRADTGAALYDEARRRADNARLRDALHWNQGWDLYRQGDFAGALAHWRSAGAERLKGPAWLPPTLALGLWRLDRREEAVRWYAAAVRTEPQLWRSPDLERLLPDWSAADREALAEVAAAWQAAPPPWP
ncbi:MAG: tetratricopeptide repeat protein [Gammaproteobacteria bacterium]|nr:tetratricopeptide repeat protein [Gammaproteobacteria bacterium]